jgi:hypothetical protein
MVVVGGTVGLVVLEYLLARYTVQFVTFQQSCNKMIKNVNQWLIRGVSGITEVDTWVYGVVHHVGYRYFLVSLILLSDERTKL